MGLPDASTLLREPISPDSILPIKLLKVSKPVPVIEFFNFRRKVIMRFSRVLGLPVIIFGSALESLVSSATASSI